MYTKIVVPIDLTHVESLEKAIATATDLARHYEIPICFIGVTAEVPTEVAHTPDEYAAKLKAFCDEHSKRHGIAIEAAAYTSHDPGSDLNETLRAAAKASAADLIVMASHIPGYPEHILSSHGGSVASHAKVSVFIVR